MNSEAWETLGSLGFGIELLGLGVMWTPELIGAASVWGPVGIAIWLIGFVLWLVAYYAK